MCGIAGILEHEPGRRPSPEALRRMAGVLHHRGPDEEGYFEDGPVSLAHRRLSIIDLSTGQQPMGTEDGSVWVVFNGEIYNYIDLKEHLEAKGHRFRTRSDTEVLLAMFLEYGLEAFPRINGMFACAFYDRRTGEIVLARDRFGKKPLFYHQGKERFLFGSEIKSLLAHGGVERKVDPCALHQYLTHSYIPGQRTILAGVRRLLPGHLLVVRNGGVTQRRYWKLAFATSAAPPDETEASEHLEKLLEGAVKRRLMSDVPLGAFLSGGLDSSVVVALMARFSDRPVRTFTIGFDEAGYSELEDARVVARWIGTDHQEMIVKPSALDILPDLVWHLDEPFGDSSAVPTYYVCRAARQHVTVALSGDGGDEVFAGYRRYQEIDRYRGMARVPPWIREKVVRPLTRTLPITWPGRNYMHALAEADDDGISHRLGIFPYIRDVLYTDDFRKAIGDYDPFEETERFLGEARHLDPVGKYQYLDTHHYLPGDILAKVDRMSMANSLEVRAPLLDHTLVEYMATLPVSFKLRGGVSKYLLRRVAGEMLPPSVLEKPKQGFAIPKDRWFKKELRSSAEEILLAPRTLAQGYFRRDTLQRMLDHHATGERDYSDWIWCLIVLETWFRTFLDEGDPPGRPGRWSEGHVRNRRNLHAHRARD